MRIHHLLVLSFIVCSCKDALDTVASDPYTEIKKALSIDPAALKLRGTGETRLRE